MTRMVYIVAYVLPLGSNYWAVVGERFNDFGDEIFVIRDQDSLKKKFDKIASMKKSTSDPSVPPDVRTAKRIAREINGTGHAGLVGGSTSEEEEVDGGEGERMATVGAPKRKREEGAQGVNKRNGNGDNELVAHVKSMSEAVTEQMKETTGTAGPEIDSLHEMVGKTISDEMSETKRFVKEQRDSIAHLMTMLNSAVPPSQ